MIFNNKNVLSLFNGMGCGWIALDRVNIKVNKRYSSEIDKYSSIVNDKNYPDTIQLGDVRNVDVSKLEPIHLLIGGSPCQSFSFAGKRNGMTTKSNVEIVTLEHYLELKKENFEFEGQSYLFWEYMRILKQIQVYNPDVKFMLENVIMGEKWQKVLTRAIGINPIRINASLVSAQNRDRLFWTNIAAEPDGLFGDIKCTIPQPKDRGILLKDILETDVDEKYYLSEKTIKTISNTFNNHIPVGKSPTLTTELAHGTGRDFTPRIAKEINAICVASRGRNPENPSSREAGIETEQHLEPRADGKTNCLTSVQKDNLVVYGCDYRKDEGLRFRQNGKSGTLAARARNDESCGQLASINKSIRRLTPTECERLQRVDDGYTNHVSSTQRYKMLGNGWNCEVIAHIFSYLNPETQTQKG